jgi:hypothetical protein
MFGVGNTAAQPRGMQQPPAQPLSSSQPNLRAQVPPPLLSPQVNKLPGLSSAFLGRTLNTFMFRGWSSALRALADLPEDPV